MIDKDLAAVQRELSDLRARVAELEEEATAAEPPSLEWTRGLRLLRHDRLLLACSRPLPAGLQHRRRARRRTASVAAHSVYLTFGMGGRALELHLHGGEGGLMLIIGCCLYIATGMLLGTLFQVVLSRFAGQAGLGQRMVLASALALTVWIVNYYLLLSWIQPLLFGGNWIVALIPWWVAALTHLVFGWTMALVYPLGTFEPYRVRID
jgi:hypothetical protein